jgi:hypothetical protein
MKRHRLRESLDGVALVRLDDLVAFELSVGVSGPGDLLLALVDDREGGEALGELAAPSRGDGVRAALGARVGDAAGGGVASLDNGEVAAVLASGAGVDNKGPGAASVGGVADALHVLNGPGSLGRHGLDLGGGSRSGDGAAGHEGGENGDDGELHVGLKKGDLANLLRLLEVVCCCG